MIFFLQVYLIESSERLYKQRYDCCFVTSCNEILFISFYCKEIRSYLAGFFFLLKLKLIQCQCFHFKLFLYLYLFVKRFRLKKYYTSLLGSSIFCHRFHCLCVFNAAPCCQYSKHFSTFPNKRCVPSSIFGTLVHLIFYCKNKCIHFNSLSMCLL